MATANILTLADAIVSAINTAWTGKGANDSVSRVYLAPVSVDDLDSLTGRKVYVFPGPYDNGLANRGEDEWTYTLGILIVERYTDAGDPTTAWIDDRVDFVEGTVGETIDYNGRTLLSISSRRIWTESIEVETYNLESLNQKKIFWSVLTAVFKELKAG